MRLRRGFTILELLLVMSIMTMVMTMIHSALAVSSKICTGGRDRAGLYHGARLAMDDILAAFDNMEYCSTGKYEFIVQSGDFQGLPSDSVEMVTLVPPMMLEGKWLAGEARVRYQISVNEDNTCFLEKQIWPVEGDMPDPIPSISLAEGICGLEISYYDVDGNPTRVWNTTEEEEAEGEGSPYEAVVTLYVDQGSDVKPLMSAVVLPTMKSKSEAAAGSGRNRGNGDVPEMEPGDGEAPSMGGGGPRSGGSRNGGSRGGSGGGSRGGSGGSGGHRGGGMPE